MSVPRTAGPALTPLTRPREGRLLGGVAAGVGKHLGVPVPAVRLALAVGFLFNGAGAVLYLWLWVFAPVTSGIPGSPGNPGTPPTSGTPPPSGYPGRSGRGWVRAFRPVRWWVTDVLVGALLLLLAAALYARARGWDVQAGAVLPALVMAGGALVAYTQLDEVERNRWTAGSRAGGRAAALRMIGGLGLVLLGIQVALVQHTDVATAGRMLVSAGAVLLGAGLVLAPWAVRLWQGLDAERAARAREAERADIAAHLHDSVLQTLALIQRHSGDPAAVSRLARAQERDLRQWLYGAPTERVSTLAGFVRQVAAEAEDVHGAAVEVVVVGDTDLVEPVASLGAAVREAIVNAARHAGGTVQVYVECGPRRIEAFVRDRGPGFDPAAVPGDRWGVRESIVGRMERHGGIAEVRSAPGEGSEVRLALPLPEEEG